MLFLIEGPDRCGKSTLAHSLSQTLDIPILHFGVPPSDPTQLMEFFLTPIQEALKTHEHFVIDRYHLSNEAYQETFGCAVLPAADWFWLDAWIESLGTFLFMLVDNPRAIYERVQAEGKDQLTMQEIGEILNRFNESYGRSQITPKGSFKLTQLINNGRPTVQWVQTLRAISEEMGRPWKPEVLLPAGVTLST